MLAVDLSIKVLTLIKKEHLSFVTSIRKVTEEAPENLEQRGNVSAMVGCELRHDIFFNYIIQNLKLSTKDNDCLLAFLFANHFFLKRINEEDFLKEVKEILTSEDYEKVLTVINYTGSPIDYLPTSLPRESLEFTSIRFNTPIQIVKMWQNHFGRGLTFKTLKRNNKPNASYVALKPEFAMKGEEFVNGPIEGIKVYTGKKPIRHYSEFRNLDIYPLRPAVKELIEKYTPDDIQEVSAYIDNDPGAAINLLYRFKNKTINIATRDIHTMPDVIHLIRKDSFPKVNYFSLDPSYSMDASISRLQEIFIVFPESSGFDHIKHQPDFFANFDLNSFDELIKHEKAILESSSKYILDKGKILYMVDTLNKKEARSVVFDFLSHHNDFKLVEDKQLFPFDNLDTTLYYAVIEKVENHD